MVKYWHAQIWFTEESYIFAARDVSRLRGIIAEVINFSMPSEWKYREARPDEVTPLVLAGIAGMVLQGLPPVARASGGEARELFFE